MTLSDTTNVEKYLIPSIASGAMSFYIADQRLVKEIESALNKGGYHSKISHDRFNGDWGITIFPSKEAKEEWGRNHK